MADSAEKNLLLQQPQTESEEENNLYLWPRSKVWMQVRKRAFKAQQLKSQI
ncbi:hypothetical protein EUBHAL_00109 [Anaerobutyricum hallii DSM 3353]|uniref:Uncharacterized protein n=1 Tax=Anaerobutyricum hallii DSM 3353 TaxID=411469 RepID=C0ERU9_9FIRM|nr:hypothetical protein EUBHAL_00109 [Anaerobutyricum hallii DSM 3353]